MLVSIKKRRRFQAPFFDMQSIDVKNIILVKVECSTLYTILRGFLEKIKFLLTTDKKYIILINS